MILAKYSDESTDWEYTDATRNYLYNLLRDTIYSASKRKHYEYLIQGELTQAEYESFKYQFKLDRIDPITMKGAGNMGEIKYKLKKLDDAVD